MTGYRAPPQRVRPPGPVGPSNSEGVAIAVGVLVSVTVLGVASYFLLKHTVKRRRNMWRNFCAEFEKFKLTVRAYFKKKEVVQVKKPAPKPPPPLRQKSGRKKLDTKIKKV